jgi:hypothetical protein
MMLPEPRFVQIGRHTRIAILNKITDIKPAPVYGFKGWRSASAGGDHATIGRNSGAIRSATLAHGTVMTFKPRPNW